MPETFESFLRIWIAENISSLGSQTDATNLKYILRVRADDWRKPPRVKGSTANSLKLCDLMAALKATCSINLRKRIQAQRQADAAAQHCLTTPHSNSVKLVLVSARKSRGGDHWDKDDYDVRLARAEQ
ncbi:MAG: hypothetical protein WCB26_05050 [Pseudolabrys sp.]